MLKHKMIKILIKNIPFINSINMKKIKVIKVKMEIFTKRSKGMTNIGESTKLRMTYLSKRHYIDRNTVL